MSTVEVKAKEVKRTRALIRRDAADLKPKAIKWLWRNRVAMGAVNLIAGEGDSGKSTITYDMAARISNGDPWPNKEGFAPEGSVILFNREDPEEQVIKPRLIAASANFADGRIELVLGIKNAATGKGQGGFSLKEDLDLLWDLLDDKKDVVAVVFDPISSYFGDANAWKESEVRQILEPLAKLAETWEVAVIGVAHLGKDPKQSSANMKVLNSVGITNVARTVNMVVADRERSKTHRLFGPTKKNIIDPRTPNLCFSTEWVSVNGDIGGAHIHWEEEDNRDMKQLIVGTENKKTRRDRCTEWLKRQLLSGPEHTNVIYDRGSELGFSDEMIRRVLDNLGGTNSPDGHQGPWMMRLPTWGPGLPPKTGDSETSKKS